MSSCAVNKLSFTPISHIIKPLIGKMLQSIILLGNPETIHPNTLADQKHPWHQCTQMTLVPQQDDMSCHKPLRNSPRNTTKSPDLALRCTRSKSD